MKAAMLGGLGLFAALFGGGVVAQPPAQKVELEIAVQPIGDALNEFAHQAGLQVVFYTEVSKGLTSPALTGRFTPEEALTQLLANTPLRYQFINEHTIAIRTAGSEDSATRPVPAAAQSGPRLARVEPPEQARDTGKSAEEDRGAVRRSAAVPEILVEGSRILNMDIQRSMEDPQPYVVFNRESIERSGAVNINEFLKYRLSANATAAESMQSVGFRGAISNINLRGLGNSQTLILIDGRRTASISDSGTPVQPDLNGIPLSAIERIEVLPTTASGIYGGGATGGVVNVVLRRDYSGMELNYTHQNTFDSDATGKNLNASVGFNLEGGRTNIMVAGGYSEQNPLQNRDRDFVLRGRAELLRNNPGEFQAINSSIPTGATPNIRSVDRSNLVLKFNNTPLNSSFTYIPDNYAGVQTDNGLALLANAGKYNLGLAQSRQVAAGGNAGTSGAFMSLLSAPTVKTVTTTVRREFTPKISAFVEVGGANNVSYTPANASLQGSAAVLPVSSPNNPFTTPILVQVPDASADGFVTASLRSRRAIGGLIARLPKGWTSELDYTWSRTVQSWFSPQSDSAAGRAALASGVASNGTPVNVMRDLRVYPLNLDQIPGLLQPYQQRTEIPFETTAKNSTLRVSGPFLKLPAGTSTLSSLIEHREDALSDSKYSTGAGIVVISPSKSQSVSSAYLEALIPLASTLELQLAGRYDRYTTTGATGLYLETSNTTVVRETNRNSSVNPTVALRYQPLPDVALRASYGTGFLPPDVTQLVRSPQPTTTTNLGTDPRRNNEPVTGFSLGGGNPDLDPEKSETTSFGIILTPQWVSGLRLSIDYTKLTKTDNILALQSQQVIDNENILGSRVVRAAPSGTDPAGYAGRILSVDVSLANVARAELEAFDLQLSYLKTLGAWGSLDLFTGATRTTHYRTQIAPTTPVLDNVGHGATSMTAANPPSLKANAGLAWRINAWTLGWNTSYFHSYLNYLASDSPTTRLTRMTSQGNGTGRIPSQMYHDVFAAYGFDTDTLRARAISRSLSQLELRAGVKNVFNKEPPFDAGNTTYFYSSYADPRLATYYLNLKLGF